MKTNFSTSPLLIKRTQTTQNQLIQLLPVNLKVGRAVLSPPQPYLPCGVARGAVRTPRPTRAARLRDSMREAFRGILSPRWVLAMGAVVIGLGAGPTPCSAATITVKNVIDSGTGSLRQALADASDGDTINFAINAYGTITLTTGRLEVTNSVTILGPGATHVAVNGNYPNATNRVFYIAPSKTVTIAGLTISNGFASGVLLDDNGGGIFNDHSTLTISNCVVSGNSAGFVGGGIYNDGGEGGSATLTVVNSTLSGNSASGSGLGGGIFNDGFNFGSATLTVENSTLSGNSAGLGGGIDNFGEQRGSATLEVLNSTLSGNSANSGGGIYNNGSIGSATLEVLNSTLSGNSAEAIFNSGSGGSANLHIGSTILNAGASGANLINVAGTISSLGYNLSSDDGSGLLNQSTDQTNTNPKLGPLQDNGGPTFTHALLCGSPAIDQGTNFSGFATDQRGFPRTFDNLSIPKPIGGDGTDIGAFEEFWPNIVTCAPAVTNSANANCQARVPDFTTNIVATDDCTGSTNLVITQSPAARTLVGLGTTMVTLYVADAARNTNTCMTTFTVVAETPPHLSCPGELSTNATNSLGATVFYPAATASGDNCGGAVSITYSQNAGTFFPIGDTKVTVTATDASGNSATPCTFTVHVKGAVEQINNLIAYVNTNVRSPYNTPFTAQLQAVLSELALNNKAGACSALQDFLSLVAAQSNKRLLTAAEAAELTKDGTRIGAVIGCS